MPHRSAPLHTSPRVIVWLALGVAGGVLCLPALRYAIPMWRWIAEAYGLSGGR